jgi:hypothetical protein
VLSPGTGAAREATADSTTPSADRQTRKHKHKQKQQHNRDQISIAAVSSPVPPPQQKVESAPQANAPQANTSARKRPASRLPGQIHFPLLVAFSFALASLGDAFVAQLFGDELAAVSRLPASKAEYALLGAWKLCVFSETDVHAEMDDMVYPGEPRWLRAAVAGLLFGSARPD